jgi:hypothetical protein
VTCKKSRLSLQGDELVAECKYSNWSDSDGEKRPKILAIHTRVNRQGRISGNRRNGFVATANQLRTKTRRKGGSLVSEALVVRDIPEQSKPD